MKFGAHVSAAQPFSEAVNRAKELQCECMQVFVNDPQRWKPKAIPENELELFKVKNKEANIEPVLIHSIYLVNLASYNTFYYQSSIESLIDDMKKGQAIGAFGVNFHVGAAINISLDDAYEKIKEAINQILTAVPEGPDLVLENSAGAGNVIGDTFEELAKIIEMADSPRVKVCLDTAHAFESGYDIRTEEGVEDTIKKFDSIIGIDRLVALHLNDSKTALNSRHDRHADIGAGEIGLDAFRTIVNHPLLKGLPGILETPSLKGKGEIDNLKILKEMRI